MTSGLPCLRLQESDGNQGPPGAASFPPTPQRAGDRTAWNLPEMEWVPQVPMGGLTHGVNHGKFLRGRGRNEGCWVQLEEEEEEEGYTGGWEGNAWD